MRNLKFLAELIHLLITKGGSIVCDKDIWNPKMVNYMLVDEGGYRLAMHSGQRDCLHPFYKILYGSQDVLMLR